MPRGQDVVPVAVPQRLGADTCRGAVPRAYTEPCWLPRRRPACGWQRLRNLTVSWPCTPAVLAEMCARIGVELERCSDAPWCVSGAGSLTEVLAPRRWGPGSLGPVLPPSENLYLEKKLTAVWPFGEVSLKSGDNKPC